MDNKLRENLPYTKTIVYIAVLAALSGVLTSLVGELLLPFAAAFYAALLLFEKNTKKTLSVFIGVAIVVANVAIGIAMKSYIPILSIEIVLVAFAIFYMYSKGFGKGECVFIVTAIITVMLVLSLIFSAFYAQGEYTWEAVNSFYSEFYENAKLDFIEQLTDITAALPDGTAEMIFSTEEAGNMFDSIVSALISFLIIIGFFIAGITFKIFSLIVRTCADKQDAIKAWSFSTSNVVAYFYIALILLSFFVGAGTDVIAVTVSNLYNVFMFVYAYIGFKYAHAVFSAKKNPVFVFIILIIAVLLMSSFAITLLSMFGVFYTFGSNKSTKAS